MSSTNLFKWPTMTGIPRATDRGGGRCGWVGGWMGLKDWKYSSRTSVWRKKRENPLLPIYLFMFALIGLIGSIPVCDHMRRLFCKARMLYESIIHCLSYYYGFWFDSCRATALHRGWIKMQMCSIFSKTETTYPTIPCAACKDGILSFHLFWEARNSIKLVNALIHVWLIF